MFEPLLTCFYVWKISMMKSRYVHSCIMFFGDWIGQRMSFFKFALYGFNFLVYRRHIFFVF